jgi:hypothetical protein
MPVGSAGLGPGDDEADSKPRHHERHLYGRTTRDANSFGGISMIDRRFVFSVILGAALAAGCASAASPSPSVAPTSVATASPSPAPTDVAVLAMTKTFTSANYGYAVGYPAGWQPESASSMWWPPTWKGSDDYSGFDFLHSPLDGEGVFRSASAAVPEGVSVDDWIDRNIIQAEVGTCNPPRATLSEVTIDGQAGRIRDECPEEVETTVVVGRRVYVFTLFLGASNRRALFDAFAATIDLRPDDAVASPTPSSS